MTQIRLNDNVLNLIIDEFVLDFSRQLPGLLNTGLDKANVIEYSKILIENASESYNEILGKMCMDYPEINICNRSVVYLYNKIYNNVLKEINKAFDNEDDETILR